MKKPLVLTLLSVIFVIFGCQSKEELPTREKSLSKGFTMMDEGRYDDAIVYFSELIQTDTHYHVKLALASAYAGRAGVKIEQVYSFVVVKHVEVPEVQITGLSLDKQTKETMATLSRLSEQWGRIPGIETPARKDLQAGLRILEGDLTPGVRLYAATLRIVVLKSSVQQGLQNFEVLSSKKLCTKELRPYMTWAGKIVEGLSELAMDLEASFPDQKESYAEARLKLETLKTQVLSLKWPEGDKCF